MKIHFLFETTDSEGLRESFRFDQEILWPGVPRPGDAVDAPIRGPGDDPNPWIVESVYWNADGSVGLYLGNLKLPGPHDADETYLKQLREHATRKSR
jgi:hypothetical protein